MIIFKAEELEEPSPALPSKKFPTKDGACNITKVMDESAIDDVRDAVLQTWKETRDNWVLSPDNRFYQNLGGLLPATYFGNFYRPEAGDDFEPPMSKEFSFDEERRGHSKYRDFIVAKESGKIWVQPLIKSALRATINPGLDSSKLRSYSIPSTRVLRNFAGYFPEVYNEACRVTGALYPSLEPYLGSHSWVYLRQWNQRIYGYKATENPFVFPTDDDVSRACLSVLRQIHAISSSSTDVVLRAKSEANNPNLDFLTMLAEMPSTIKYLIGLLSTGIGLLVQFKKTRRELIRKLTKHRSGLDPKKVADAVTDLWLQYEYAIRPIIADVEGTLEHLSKRNVAFDTTRKSSTLTREFHVPGWEVDDVDVITRCWIKRRYDVSKNFGAGFLTTNILLTAWELVPFSFVVDWFVRVGDYLSASSPPSHFLDQGAIFSKQVPKGTVIELRRDDGVSISLSLGTYQAQPLDLSASSGLFKGTLLNWRRSMDGVALVWQVARSRLRTA